MKTIESMSRNGASMNEMDDKHLLKMFDDVFDQIMTDLINDSSLKQIPAAASWFQKILAYNVPHGKKNRGVAVLKSYISLSKTAEQTEENFKLACILGWCIELLQAFFLIADDIMDQSEMRRGKPCWYKKDDNGLLAFNDSILLESAVYILLKKYFKDSNYYVHLLELFNKTTFQTSLGQCLDMLSNHNKPNFDNFVQDHYTSIVQYKTAYYSFYLPVALAMYMCGKSSEEEHDEAKHILIEIGKFFQAQDDFLDCFGDPDIMGKIGTDIEEGKCTWLVVNALKLANEDQITLIKNNYGKQDEDKVNKIKEIYADLNLPSLFDMYQESSYDRIISTIDAKVTLLPKEIFIWFIKKIYKRTN